MTHRQHQLVGTPTVYESVLESTQYSKYHKHVLSKDGQIIFSSDDEKQFEKIRLQYLDGGYEVERIVFIADQPPGPLEKAKALIKSLES